MGNGKHPAESGEKAILYYNYKELPMFFLIFSAGPLTNSLELYRKNRKKWKNEKQVTGGKIAIIRNLHPVEKKSFLVFSQKLVFRGNFYNNITFTPTFHYY